MGIESFYAQRLPVGTSLVWIKKADRLFNTFLSDAEVAWMKGGYGVYCFRKTFPPPLRIQEGNGKVLHPNQKPIALLEWCLSMAKVTAGMTVLDPYMGSGSTGVACMRMGINFIGIEKDPGHFETSEIRIPQAQAQPLLFEVTA
jgi:site-specific DNA-methyltransferase (adenine-specific)